VVLYESPHRLVKLLEQLEPLIEPTRKISVSRELLWDKDYRRWSVDQLGSAPLLVASTAPSATRIRSGVPAGASAVERSTV